MGRQAEANSKRLCWGSTAGKLSQLPSPSKRPTNAAEVQTHRGRSSSRSSPCGARWQRRRAARGGRRRRTGRTRGRPRRRTCTRRKAPRPPPSQRSCTEWERGSRCQCPGSAKIRVCTAWRALGCHIPLPFPGLPRNSTTHNSPRPPGRLLGDGLDLLGKGGGHLPRKLRLHQHRRPALRQQASGRRRGLQLTASAFHGYRRCPASRDTWLAGIISWNHPYFRPPYKQRRHWRHLGQHPPGQGRAARRGGTRSQQRSGWAPRAWGRRRCPPAVAAQHRMFSGSKHSRFR